MPAQEVADLLAGRTPRRLPWVPEINEGFARKLLNEPPGSSRAYRLIERDAARRIRGDYLHRVKTVRVSHRRVELEEQPDGVNIFHTPAGDLRRQRIWDPTSGTLLSHELLVKGPESFSAYKAMIEDEHYELAPRDEVEDEITGSDLATIDVPASPLQHLIMWDMGVQEALMCTLEHPAEMTDLLAFVHEKNKEFYRVAVRGPGQIFRPMEDTSSKLTGPRMYREHCTSQMNDYARIVHDAGRQFIVHMCGHLGGAMVDVIGEIELDGVEAITPPPLGDADLPALRRKLGPEAWLIGGIDPSRFATIGPDEMRAHVRGTLDAMRGDRRFMLGHEEIPLAARLANVAVVADLVEETADWFYR